MILIIQILYFYELKINVKICVKGAYCILRSVNKLYPFFNSCPRHTFLLGKLLFIYLLSYFNHILRLIYDLLLYIYYYLIEVLTGIPLRKVGAVLGIYPKFDNIEVFNVVIIG